MYKYLFDEESCWYKKCCGKYGTDECFKGCSRYMEMHFLMNNAGIPINRQYPVILTPEEIDEQAFYALQDIKEDIVNFVNEGQHLYIWGKGTGNGKTTWALKLIQKYFDEIWAGNGFRVRGLFVHTPTFLTKIKETISFKDYEFEKFKKLILQVPLVIWDDIAATGMKDFDHANLLTYIEQRKFRGLSNIYTGNLGPDNLTAAIGQRLTSRIWNDSNTVEFRGRDRRSEV